jgi:transposase
MKSNTIEISNHKALIVINIVHLTFDICAMKRHKLYYTFAQRTYMAAKEKKQVLKEQGTLNRHSHKVVEPTFGNNPFFDPDDLAQVKYEMVRQVYCEGKTVIEAAVNFGMSRPTFYLARDAIEREGIFGLAPKKSGPQARHKLTAEVMGFVREKKNEDKSVTPKMLAEMVRGRFSVSVHPRSIERALAAEKKTPDPDTER